MEKFFRSDRLEEIYGDLVETFHFDLDRMPLWKARWKFFFGSLLFFKPSNHRTVTNTTFMLLKNYLKVSIRNFRKNQLYSTINTLGLSVGLAVVFMAMVWINHHLSFDQFHSKKDSIYEVMTNGYSSSGEVQTTQGAHFVVMEEAQLSIPEVRSATRVIHNWRWPSEQCFKVDKDKQCLYRKGLFADSTFFEVFDFEILAGDPNPIDEPKSIALSQTLAKQLYGDENPIGKTYKVDNFFEVTITAIFKDVPTTSSLQFAFVAPLDLAYRLWGTDATQMRESSFFTYLTLSTDDYNSVEASIAQLNSKKEYESVEYSLHPLNKVHLYTTFENGKATGGLIDYIKIFSLFALFTLIMSMVNFINLATAQASIRGKEVGIRKVSGASRSTLQVQFLIEIFLKIGLAAFIALVLVFYSLPFLNEVIGEEINFIFDRWIVVQIVGVIILTTILSGVYPALVLSRFNPIQVLKNLQIKGGTKSITRRWLAMLQIGISGIIIILTSVIYLQLDYLQNKNIGYDREGILIMEPTWSHIKDYGTFSNELLQYHQIKGVGVSNANMIDAGHVTSNVSWPGKLESDEMSFKQIGLNNGMFDIFEIELIQGSRFNSNDSIPQVILTESAVQLMNIDDPIGASIVHNEVERKIVGIVSDFNTESLHKSIIPAILYNVEPRYAGTVYIRYDKNRPDESLEVISNHYRKFEKHFDMKYSFLDKKYEEHYKNEQVISRLAAIVMILSAFIAGIGVLGLSTFNIVRRYREIGLRKIFGASISQIIRLLAGEFVKITFVASLITLPIGVLLVNYWLSNFAYRIEMPYELFVFNLILTLLVILILVSAQSLKVANLNPANVVRNE